MAQEFKIPFALSDEEKYAALFPQIKFLLTKDELLLSNLSNFTAALKQTFDKISWVGFYLFDGEKLYLGPFQGKVACTKIEIGKGVCGTAALKKETVIVQNVNDFPGHIACDDGTNSEIVVPILKGNELIGVLDLDSYQFNAFNETDKKYLEELSKFLAEKIFIK
ncbi:MAG: guanylate cyclase [Ignavibacteria bacterium CG_4_8_14_3_um_filter_37_9]|nr:MAG: guanylate cyclase [Ignavibacteria bacterium CG1_02_37_35]PIS44089.1 MAG: guanylate cyclase [Ignavibacteria bacterium CG08_land_8_20_14_0_20_37_9]PIW99827.1 MAG: guanylate cyclase [Ignavibacteria bacterium CG_4_8_14_3_um_filter_37_9]PIX92947.1 MAG: guanylate cyclase [Ignavibacteria bacterium CG_4_10_14_3_um_filter_37_18]PJC60651.1 MAG: guanylate cyclase [Ignavibacteria bacterium CG_4_9_14_0_2_um_filter_37_13]